MTLLYEGHKGARGDYVIIKRVGDRIEKSVENFEAKDPEPFSPSYWITREIDAAYFVSTSPAARWAYRFVESSREKGSLVTELIPNGASLKRWVDRAKRPPKEETTAFLRAGLRALQALHGDGCRVVHGDIHPGNIVVPARDGKLQWDELRFIDFAFSMRARDGFFNIRVDDKCVHGIPLFTSPYQRNECISMRDDVISLVFTAIYVFGGTLPWPNDTERSAEAKKLLVEGDAATQARLLGGLPSVVLKLLQVLNEVNPNAPVPYSLLIELLNQ